MKNAKTLFAVLAGAVFLVGVGYIIYAGRPVMELVNAEDQAQISSPAGAGSATGQPSATGAYTMADVATHGTQSSCWAAINGNVYDLTSWISRHPGGPDRIIRLCGTDGSDAFTRQHGRSQRALAALVLLKIGTLK